MKPHKMKMMDRSKLVSKSEKINTNLVVKEII
jgi:hypothetical protein